jgi:hypothetical protein
MTLSRNSFTPTVFTQQNLDSDKGRYPMNTAHPPSLKYHRRSSGQAQGGRVLLFSSIIFPPHSTEDLRSAAKMSYDNEFCFAVRRQNGYIGPTIDGIANHLPAIVIQPKPNVPCRCVSCVMQNQAPIT